MKESGLKSGSKEICLSQSFEAPSIQFEILVEKEFISRKFEFSEKLKVANENFLSWCAVQTWVSCLMGSSYYGHLGASCSLSIAMTTLLIRLVRLDYKILGGFLLTEHSRDYPLIRRICLFTNNMGASCSLSIAMTNLLIRLIRLEWNITWGLFVKWTELWWPL